MAQQDATEQVKQILREVIRYRFWIAVGFAAVFAAIAYYMGSGPVKAKAATETNAIKGALTEVQKYAANTVPTEQYKPIVEEKTEVATKDVNTAWKELYDRQAPLLTWPETVQERFRKWGRKWPEGEDPGKVQLAIVDYLYAYPAYVEMVYKTFHPFNYESGEGIVAAPPKEALLRPAVFQVEHPPDMGKVWASQERLWIQHTLLDVVDQVNKRANAKDWDSATIKQIDRLEVGNPLAQDQRSLAKSEALEQAPGIYAPGQEPQAEDTSGGGAGGGAGMAGMMGGMMDSMMVGRKGREMMMGGMGGMGMGAATGAGSQYDESIYFITPPNEASKAQYKILPVLMTVLLDQDRVQDFLVELENSPMGIQVMDFELQRPTSRVTKPEKGTQLAGFGMMEGGYGGMMMQQRMMRMGEMGMGRGMTGYGGMMGQMMSQMMQQRMMRGGEMGGYGPMMGGMGYGPQAQRKGTDARNINREKKREEESKAVEATKGPSWFDPYYEIVEVTVYGRARFFNAPPEEPKPEPSPGETAAQPEPATPVAPGGAAAPAAGQPAPAAPAAGQPAPAAPAAETSPEEKAQPAQPGTEAAKPAEPAAPTGKAQAPADQPKTAAPKG
jgi:hypothetical protein